MATEELIKKLKESNLYAECPKCSGEFKLSEAILFDGTKEFPSGVKELQQKYKDALEQRKKDLEKNKKLAKEKAGITAKSVNIGKKMETILPTMKGFIWSLPDCRFLGDPIDMITFNGLCKDRVESISFIEVKTGGSKLNVHQKAVKQAIDDKDVSFKVIK